MLIADATRLRKQRHCMPTELTVTVFPSKAYGRLDSQFGGRGSLQASIVASLEPVISSCMKVYSLEYEHQSHSQKNDIFVCIGRAKKIFLGLAHPSSRKEKEVQSIGGKATFSGRVSWDASTFRFFCSFFLSRHALFWVPKTIIFGKKTCLPVGRPSSIFKTVVAVIAVLNIVFLN